MTNQDIQCFLKLAQTLNYTKTAQLLYISQPAVTRHIHSVEAEVGAQLFDRSVRRSAAARQSNWPERGPVRLPYGTNQDKKFVKIAKNPVFLPVGAIFLRRDVLYFYMFVLPGGYILSL